MEQEQQGKELMEAVLIDKSMQLIAFFDDSKDLRDRAINNIPIYGSFAKLEGLKNNTPILRFFWQFQVLDWIEEEK